MDWRGLPGLGPARRAVGARRRRRRCTTPGGSPRWRTRCSTAATIEIPRWRDEGLDAIEVYHSEHGPADVERYRALAERSRHAGHRRLRLPWRASRASVAQSRRAILGRVTLPEAAFLRLLELAARIGPKAEDSRPKARSLKAEASEPLRADPSSSSRDVSKTYGGLRPLANPRAVGRCRAASSALAGFDQTTAEVFVNLVTGATLPEEGTVRVFGRATAEIADSADWLATVDRFGIVSERVVLLEQFTPLQNIAMSLTLDVEPLPPTCGSVSTGWRARSGSTTRPSIGPWRGGRRAAPSRPAGARAGDVAGGAADRAPGGRPRRRRDRAARRDISGVRREHATWR